jgi:hypothetical protein
MDTGMLWFDNDPKTGLSTKIERAVDYYRKKYGRDPNLCLLHPSMVEKEPGEPLKITVRAYPPVTPGHFWIGIEDKR